MHLYIKGTFIQRGLYIQIGQYSVYALPIVWRVKTSSILLRWIGNCKTLDIITV